MKKGDLVLYFGEDPEIKKGPYRVFAFISDDEIALEGITSNDNYIYLVNKKEIKLIKKGSLAGILYG